MCLVETISSQAPKAHAMEKVQRLALKQGVGASAPKQGTPERLWTKVKIQSRLHRDMQLRVMARDRKQRTYPKVTFDGDTCSLTAVMADESIDEIKQLLNSRDYYVGVSGKLVFSSQNDNSALVFAEVTNQSLTPPEKEELLV